jgi:three-Cys-motif partner protein
MKCEQGDSVPDGYAIASDGLLARKSGAWAREKLDFIDRYVGPAMSATQRKGGHTHYVDLFAGPGWNVVVDKRSGRVKDEFAGSPILVLESQLAQESELLRFQHFHFCNESELDHKLLEIRTGQRLERLGSTIEPNNVRHSHGDSNELIRELLEDIPTWAYLFAFADIEGPDDLPFATLQALKHAHKSVDLYLLFPTRDIQRLLSYKRDELEKHEEKCDRFFGTPEWRRIVGRRYTTSQAREMRRELLELYQAQLRTVWTHADTVMPIRRRGRVVLYHMLFAHDHPAAERIFRWARSKLEQLDLFGRSANG